MLKLNQHERIWDNDIKVNLNERRCQDVDRIPSGSRQGLVTVSLQHGNESSGSIKQGIIMNFQKISCTMKLAYKCTNRYVVYLLYIPYINSTSRIVAMFVTEGRLSLFTCAIIRSVRGRK